MFCGENTVLLTYSKVGNGICEVHLGKTDQSDRKLVGKKPRRKWRRRALWLLLILPLGVVAGVLIIGQTSIIQRIVEPILEDQLGVDVSSGSIRLMPTGEVVITDAIIKTDTIESRAGSLIEFDQARISMNWWGVVRGSGQVRSVVINKPIVRVSQDADTGVLNLAAVVLKKSGGGGGETPAIQILNGVLEIGEHDSTGYRLLKELSIRGQITQQDSSGVSGFDFVALPVEPSAGGDVGSIGGSFGLTGRMSDDGIDGVVNGIRLEDWPAEIVPSRSRSIYAELALTGSLEPTRFHVSKDGLIEVVLTLDGVALNLPIDEPENETDTQTSDSSSIDPLRMRQTRGVIHFGTSGLDAQLTGLIADLEYDVELAYQGLDTKGPFDAKLVTDFRLDNNFKPIDFLPTNVVSKLDRFENPQADIHAEIYISRADVVDNPEDTGIKVSGRAVLSNGSATYKKFNYPFTDMSGVIEFDPDKLVVKDITGVGPTGATLVANGLFSPLGEQSDVTLDLEVNGVGVDEYLLRALDEDQQKLVDALFSDVDYAHLIEEGLVLTQGDADELGMIRRETWERLDQWVDGVDGNTQDRIDLSRQLGEIDRLLSAPIFAYGGVANVDVKLVRHPDRPSDKRWTTDVVVQLPQAGLVSKHFPLPIIGRDIELTITDERVSLTGGRYEGLLGGSASVSVEMDTTKNGGKPIVQIAAQEFPIDQRVVAAIPGYYNEQSEDPDDISLRRILDRLRLGGVLECQAIIGPRSDGHMGYDVEATILEGSARPKPLIGSEPVSITTAPLVLDQMYGTIYITEELIIVDLDGLLTSPDMPLAPTPIQVLTQLTMPAKDRGVDGTRRVKGLLPDEFGPPVLGPRLYATAFADGIDLAMPLKHAIAVVSPRIARDIDAKLTEYNFDGVIGMNAQLEGFVGGAIESTLTLNRIEQLSFDFQETQYQVGASWGRGEFVLSGQPSISFDGFRVSVQAEQSLPSELSLDGSMPLARAGRMYELAESSSLQIGYINGAFDSPLTHAVLEYVSESGSQWSTDHKLGGRFDLGVTLTPELGLHRIPGEDDSIKLVPTAIHGSLEPKSLSVSMNQDVASFTQVQGVIRFDGFEGAIDGIRASDSQVSVGVDGRWWMNPTGGFGVDLGIDAHGDLLAGPVRVLLPDSVDGVIDRLEIKSGSPVDLKALRISADSLGTQKSTYQITGGMGISQGSALLGLPISELAGDLEFVVDGRGDKVGYEIKLDASRLRAGLMRVHDARATIIGDAQNAGVVLVPEIIASMHGGQIAGSAQLRPEIDGDTHYWMELHASGVRAAPVFDDLLLPPEGLAGPPRPGETVVLSAWSEGNDLSRGATIGDLTMTGPVGDPSKRTGRGLVRISGGSVVALPGFLNLIEASNFSLPTGATLDFAEAAFYIDGPTLAFEQLSVSSKRVEILGYGTVDWATREMDLRFRSRSTTPIPIVSKLIEQLRDELITTRVSGTMSDPQYSVQPFGSTRRLFDAMIGRSPTDQQRQLREVEDQVRASKKQIKRHAGDIVHYPIEESSGENGNDWQGWPWAKEQQELGSE